MSFEHVKNLVEAEEFDEALKVVAKTLNEHPDDPIMHYMAGRIMIEKGWAGMAKPSALQSASISPKSWEAWNLLGKAQSDLWQLDEARESFRMALQLSPKQSSPLSNMALVDQLQGRPKKAIDIAHKALGIDPECQNTKHNMGMALLSLRQWEPGWRLYEFGLGNHVSRRERIYSDPDEGRWDGTKGKTVVAYGEQGIGDEISFASTLPDLIRDSKKVVVECDSRLEGLFQRSFPEADVYGTRFRSNNAWPADYQFDGRVSFSSLQRFYRNRDEDFPGTPYLVADPERRKQWKALLDDLPGLKVGIAWTGGTAINGKQFRSLRLDDLLPILGQKASFVSLEYRDPTAEIQDFKKTGIKVHEWGRATRTQDYDDTAALVAELDLVISVTTAVIHLAGALGKECWVMTHKNPMWRYGFEGNMPWYRSIRLYRQKTDWTSVIHRVAEDLSQRLS